MRYTLAVPATMAVGLVLAVFGGPFQQRARSAPPGDDGAKIREIKARGMLVVSVKRDAWGQGHVNKDPAHFQKRGFEIDLAKALAKRLLGDEAKLELKLYRKPDRIPALRRDEADLVISMLPVTDEAKAQADYSDPYAAGGLTLLVRKGAGVEGLKGLRGKTVAGAKTNDHDFAADLKAIAREEGVAITVLTCPTDKDATEAVKAGRAQAVVSNNMNLDALLEREPGAFERAGGLLTRQEYGIAVKKGNRDLLEFVNRVLAEMKASGELKRMAETSRVAYGLP